jgi:SAM-dependent methyltransferase
MWNPSTIASPAGNVNLSYFVEWRRLLWTPAIEYLIADPKRFAGKTVLEIGCRNGRMSCLFGLLGANVLGIEMPGQPLDAARVEAQRWNLERRVSFAAYDGTPRTIPGDRFDYIFTKSVLVTIPNLDRYLPDLAERLSPHGELLAAENLSGGQLLGAVRHLWTYRHYRTLEDRLHAVDSKFLLNVRTAFNSVDVKTFYGCVAAIRAADVRRMLTSA